VRNIRRDSNEVIKGLKKDGEVSEDQQNKALEKIQAMTDDHIKLIDTVYREKEKEVLDI
jgi:ribosome recycling factor